MRDNKPSALNTKAIIFVVLAVGAISASVGIRQLLPEDLLATTAEAHSPLPVMANTSSMALTTLPSALSPSGLSLNDFQQKLETTNAHPHALQENALKAYPYRLPQGYAASWESITLDQGVSLKILSSKLPLSSTTGGLGAEYYEYSAYLYRQMATQLGNSELAVSLNAMAMSANEMARHLRKAATIRFDGLPGEDMAHLKVRSQLLSHLDELNTRTLRIRDLDEAGHAVYATQTRQDSFAPGALMQHFQTELQTLKATPEARNYPQTMALVQHQAELMGRLAGNLELRWDTVFHCSQAGQPERTVKMTLSTAQALLPEQAQLATREVIDRRISHRSAPHSGVFPGRTR